MTAAPNLSEPEAVLVRVAPADSLTLWRPSVVLPCAHTAGTTRRREGRLFAEMLTVRKAKKKRPIRVAPGYRAIDVANADQVKAMEDGAEWCARYLEMLAAGLQEEGKEAHGIALLGIASMLREQDMAWAADALRVERAALPPGYSVRPVGNPHVIYEDGRTVEPRWEAHGPSWRGSPQDARWRAVQDAMVHSGEFKR